MATFHSREVGTYFPFTFTYQNEPIKCIHVHTNFGYHLSYKLQLHKQMSTLQGGMV